MMNRVIERPRGPGKPATLGRMFTLAAMYGFLEREPAGAVFYDESAFLPFLRARRERTIAALLQSAMGRIAPASPRLRRNRIYPPNGKREIARRRRQVERCQLSMSGCWNPNARIEERCRAEREGRGEFFAQGAFR